jgi:hypothetical protein
VSHALPLRLSMWSGPRNISTALMRSFGSRLDCQVVDEPFYAYYLNETKLDHPMKAEVIQSQPTCWKSVITDINGSMSSGKSVLYLKHMAQHMLAGVDKSHFLGHVNCFLIRDPRLVISSFSEKWDQIDAASTGFEQQLELFKYFEKHSDTPSLVIEGEDILKNPEKMLKTLCTAAGISYDPAMLKWKKGRRLEDGVWAAHWYNAVEASTGFAPFTPKNVTLTQEQEELAERLNPSYQFLRQRKLQPADR